MKNLWCYACGKIHRPGDCSHTQQEFKLDKKCVDGGVAIQKWKTNSSGQDLLLEGGKPVEIKPEKVKIKKEEHVANKNCYYAALGEDEHESDGGSSDECHDDSSGDEADSDQEEDGMDANSGSSDSSSEENDLDFNQDFSSATLEPGPSQRELQHAEELARAAAKRGEEKAESARVKASWVCCKEKESGFWITKGIRRCGQRVLCQMDLSHKLSCKMVSSQWWQKIGVGMDRWNRSTCDMCWGCIRLLGVCQ